MVLEVGHLGGREPKRSCRAVQCQERLSPGQPRGKGGDGQHLLLAGKGLSQSPHRAHTLGGSGLWTVWPWH